MIRSHNCGELKLTDVNKKVILSGWVQKIRNKGFIIWIDLRDRYGITQLVFDEKRSSKKIFDSAKNISREFVIKINGQVIERESKNDTISTGSIEVLVNSLEILNPSKTPPFTIEENSIGSRECGWSGPLSFLSNVKCFSTTHPPNAIEPSITKSPGEWSEYPVKTLKAVW